MSETYTQDELGRAWGEVDSILGEDYRNERLAKICLQARKNRLWEAHGNVEEVTIGFREAEDA